MKAVDLYLEGRKSRQYVGRLSKEKKSFVFRYDTTYMRGNSPLSVGPDLPAHTKEHRASKLFPSFEDRIPSKRNPAYKNYCCMVGISPFEKNPFVLLATLGRKGPSSFICAPVLEEQPFSNKDLKQFRKNLNLSIREFADVFDVSSSTVYKIENHKTTGRDTLKQLAIYYKSPKATLDKIKHTGHKIHERKQTFVENFFKKQLLKEMYCVLGEFVEPKLLAEIKSRIPC